ncbi:50S ribosomal protein L18 [Patescibacteria group bacterium]|nr:50S ribosomal protein L18 [Patescibacteria group bacterium]
MRKLQGRIKRHKIIRKKINGTADIPRLSVFRSNKNLYVQAIDDIKKITLLGKGTFNIEKKDTKTNMAYSFGEEFGNDLIKMGIKKVVFDRGGYKYHGRVKSFAEGVKKSGLVF